MPLYAADLEFTVLIFANTEEDAEHYMQLNASRILRDQDLIDPFVRPATESDLADWETSLPYSQGDKEQRNCCEIWDGEVLAARKAAREKAELAAHPALPLG